MANDIVKGMGFSHMALGVSDFDKSMKFYTDLGLKLYAQWGEGDSRVALLDIGDGSKLEIFAGKKNMPIEGCRWMHFAFAVQDVEKAYATALEAGAVAFKPPYELPLASSPIRLTLRIAFVKGPDGEELEFFKQIVNKF